MHRPHRMLVVAVAAGLFASGCYGPFYLTRKVWKFNGEVSDNKWVVELVYLVCTWLPVYGIAGLADALIFNSIEFWTGNNPLAGTASAGASTPVTKRIVRQDTEAVLTRLPGPQGDELLIEQFHQGQLVSSLRLQRRGDDMVALGGDGAVLFSAQTLANGRTVIADANGRELASYSSQQARQLLASLPQ